ncbi:hypothetical protein GOBAR_DD33563 [Gossypium barbadense]|nr:hypothetical protein GOBAR_DD33563 [Gossypium barbadense]
MEPMSRVGVVLSNLSSYHKYDVTTQRWIRIEKTQFDTVTPTPFSSSLRKEIHKSATKLATLSISMHPFCPLDQPWALCFNAKVHHQSKALPIASSSL